jgi:zinc protease
MFNGSENFNDEYFKPFEQVGATGMNGTTWFDRTNYFQNVPTPALEMAMWMESDRMGHLLGAVTQEKLDEQRGVVQNEKRQGDNQPYGLVEYRTLEGLYPEGHPYRHSTIGSMDDLNAAALEDVHQWFKDYYGSANAVLVLAGDLDVATARPLAEKYFGDIPAGPPLKQMKSWIPDRVANTRETMLDRVPQARIYRNWAIPGRITREAALLEMAADILGDGKNSRLYQELVYKNKLASNVSADFQGFELTSLFTVDVTLQPDADVERVNGIIDAVMADFLAAGPTKEELDRARTKHNASLIRGLEQIGGFGGKAVALAQGELYAGDAGFFSTRLDWINAAATEEVHSTSKAWLSDGYYQLDVLPFPEYSTHEATADRSRLPDVGTMPELSFPEIQRAQLSNGIEVVLAERHTIPIVNLAIQFDAGYAADSTNGKLGNAGFSLAMLDEGTANRSALEISAEAESLGANLSTSSNLDTSSVNVSALKSKLVPTIDLFADVVINPAFDQSEIDRLRGRWLSQIAQEKNQPVGVAMRMLPPLIYGDNHAYGIPMTGSGTEAAIESLSRDDMVQFHNDWIRPDNATLFVAGDTSLEEIVPMLEDVFGDWTAPASAMKQKNIADVSLPQNGRVIIVDKPDSPQSMILAGHVAPPTGVENNIAIESMNDVLGGQFTARVNMNLREDKSWSYGAFTFMQNARGQRPYMVYAPVQTDRTGDSIKELVKEFDQFLGDKPADLLELDKVVKNNVRSLPGQYETAGAVLNSMLSNQRFGRSDDYVPSLKAKYEGLNLENIQGAAEEVLNPDKLIWLIIGDRAEIESQLSELNLGEIEIMDSDGNLVE